MKCYCGAFNLGDKPSQWPHLSDDGTKHYPRDCIPKTQIPFTQRTSTMRMLLVAEIEVTPLVEPANRSAIAGVQEALMARLTTNPKTSKTGASNVRVDRVEVVGFKQLE